MKNFKIISALAIILVAFSSCTSADEPVDAATLRQLSVTNVNSGGSTSTSTGVVGTYKLTAFNTSVPTDLNGDGISSTNQMNETSCFNNSLMVLSATNTFIANSKGVDINGTVTPNTLTCFTDPDTTGTYSLSTNILTTSYVESGVTYNDNFTVSGNTLIYTKNNGSVVGMAGGNPVILTCTITIIYTKQ